jgi:hypothetical protein
LIEQVVLLLVILSNNSEEVLSKVQLKAASLADSIARVAIPSFDAAIMEESSG